MHERIVLITGASSGIGRALALRLAGSARLALVARRGDRLADLAALITARGGQSLAIPADLAAPGGPEAAVSAVEQAWGRIDAVVNNAGLLRGDDAAGGIEAQVAINLAAPVRLIAAALPALRRSRGCIINVSSLAAVRVYQGCGIYSATKAGLEAWSRCLREEQRSAGIRVCVVAPGSVDTAFWEGGDAAFRSSICSPDDIARCIAFCLDLPPTMAVEHLVVAPVQPAG